MDGDGAFAERPAIRNAHAPDAITALRPGRHAVPSPRTTARRDRTSPRPETMIDPIPPVDLPALQTERLVVRLAEPDDVPALLRYYGDNREHLAASRPTVPPEFYTHDFWLTQVHASRAEFRNDRSARLFLFRRDEPGRVVGNANFTQIQRGPSQSCVLGYGVDRGHEGQGLMREGLQAAIAYVFGTLRLHRIMANYEPWNERSGGLLRRLGFRVEGFAYDYLRLNGRWRDHILTSLVNPDWRE